MKRLLTSALGLLGYRVQGIRYCPRQLLEPTCCRAIEFDDIVCRRMFECGPELTFIQVGAFDGITRDPLRKYIDKCGWSGVLVEPQARAANQLRKLYRRNDPSLFCRPHWTAHWEPTHFLQWTPKPPPPGLVD